MKKQFFILLNLASITCFAQMGSWTTKANLPLIGNGISECAAFQIGSKGYLACGWDGLAELNTLWEYDPAGDSWTQKANFIGNARVSAVGFAINGKGYVGTGRNQSTYYTDFYEYDPIGNSWSAKANFGGVGRTRAVGFVIDSLGYIGTGADNNINPLSDFWKYSPASNTWVQKQSVPSAKREATAFAVNGKGYIGSGLPTQNSFYEYDPVANTWTAKANFPNLVCSGAWGFSMNTYGYVYYWINALNNFYQYNPSTNTWAVKATFPGSGRYYSRGFVWGQNAYVGTGGQSSPSAYYKDWYEYNTGLVGVKESSLENFVSVYPNPFQENITVQLDKLNGTATVEIFSLLGEKVYSTQITNLQTEIDLGKIENGIYFIKITTPEGQFIKKIIKE